MAFYINEQILKWCLYHKDGRKCKYTKKELQELDDSLKKSYEKHIKKFLPDKKIIRNKKNRSIIILLAQIANISSDNDTRIKNACKMFLSGQKLYFENEPALHVFTPPLQGDD